MKPNTAQQANDTNRDNNNTNESGLSRRNYLSAVGVTLLSVSIAGCGGSDTDESEESDSESVESDDASAGAESNGESEPQPDDEDVDGDADDAEGTVEDLEPGEDLEEFEGLVITEHNMSEGDWDGHTIIEGIVENTRDESVDYVEVRVRIFDTDGNQLENWFTNTTDVDAGGTWAFSVDFFEDIDDIGEYDVAVVDSPLA